jgi:hypothetical protein
MSKLLRLIKNIEFIPMIHDIFIYPYRYLSYYTRKAWYRSYYGKSLVIHIALFFICTFYGVIMSFFFIDKKFSNINVSVASLSSLNPSIRSSIARMPKVENFESQEIDKNITNIEKTIEQDKIAPKEDISKNINTLSDKVISQKIAEKDANVNLSDVKKVDNLIKQNVVQEKKIEAKKPTVDEKKMQNNTQSPTTSYKEITDNTGFGSASGVREIIDSGDQQVLTDKIIISKYLQKLWNSVNMSRQIPNDIFVAVVVNFNQNGYISSYEIVERRYILQEKNDIYLYMCSKVREILDSVEKIDGLDPKKYAIWQKSRVNFRSQNVE